MSEQPRPGDQFPGWVQWRAKGAERWRLGVERYPDGAIMNADTSLLACHRADPDYEWEPLIPQSQAEAEKREAVAAEREACAKEVPTNWLDPLLTGERSVLGPPPWGGNAVERLLRSVQARIRARTTEETHD